jgi:hypothetical protein
MPVDALQAMPVAHAWDDGDPYLSVGDPDPKVVQALRGVSQRAKKAFAIAAAEWVVFRFGKLSESPLPLYYVEASWAGLVKWKLCYLWDPGHKDKDGPVRGPIDMTMRELTNCHRALKLGEGEIHAATIDKIARHVIPDPASYLAWQKEALARLHALYPLNPDDPFGPLVPRQALDPGVPLAEVAPDEAGPLLNAYVNGLDFDKNEFLNKAALAS